MVVNLNNKVVCFIFIAVLSCNFEIVIAFSPNNVSAIQYRIDKEWAVIWINKDGSIELHYNITITYQSAAQGYITIGMPVRGFKVDSTSVKDLSGNILSYTDVSGQTGYPEFAVEVYFGHSMSQGSSDTVLLVATVPNMLSPDKTNSGYMGMQFVPTYFSDATVVNLRVAIVPPQGVTKDNIKTSEIAFLTTVDGAFAVYWERSNLAPNTQLVFGVSVPQQYITLPGPNIWFYLAIALFIIGTILIIILLFRRLRKAVYEKPKISIEALGAARGLTAVEAAVIVEVKPVRVLMMILFGLLRKRVIMVKETEPLIKLQKTDPSEQDKSPPRYYEIDFLSSIEAGGSLNERALAKTYLGLRDSVDRKMKGYSRIDTVNYYKSVVANAWNQVTQANTPELKGDALESNLDWLLMDESYNDKFSRTFPPDIVIMPRPNWYWYWYGPYFPRGSTPPTTTLGTPTEIKPIPAQEWANNVVKGLELTSNNIVKNVQDFTNKLVAPQAVQSSKPVREGSSCVCACAHCACACACVGCACACAGGGAR